MKKNINLFYILAPLLLLFMVSCEKDISLDLPRAEEKIVVEGWIENGQVPHVALSRNASYFDVIDEAAIMHMFNVDAVVKVREVETGIEETLTKTINPSFLPPVLYKGSTLTGKIKHHYELLIEVDGKSLTATTYIPDTISTDSTYFKAEPLLDTLGGVYIMFQDPPLETNYYRIFTKRLSKDPRFVPVWGSIYDDIFFNGQYINYSFYRGIDFYATQPEEYEEDDFMFCIGDTIVTRFCAIDKAHYDFWRTYENAIYSGGNPFASPATIATNVSGALGVWGGYAAVYDTTVAAVAP